MNTTDIVVLTDDRYVKPSYNNDYINNILLEDGLIQSALKKVGFNVERLSWSDSSYNWHDTKYALFRTTWDYFDRFSEFKNWLTNTSKQTTFINHYDLIKWNLDKHYLADLEKQQIPIVPTRFIEINENLSLIEELKSNEVILKPTISGAGRHTYRVNKDNVENCDKILQELIQQEAMMIQPFLQNIMTKGEISLILINGKYSHAVLKKAKPGDFRVQDDFGGTVHDYQPNTEEILLAEQAVQACPILPLYARVDIVWDNNNDICIGELELIEPELFFRNKPASANLLAEAIVERYGI